MRLFIFWVLIFLSVSAQATLNSRALEYPSNFPSRPLLIPPTLKQTQFQFLYAHNQNPAQSSKGIFHSPVNVSRFSFGLDLGTSEKLQVGGFMSLQATPGTEFSRIQGNAILALGNAFATRLDVGLKRVYCEETFSTGTAMNPETGVFLGLGIPVKYAFTPGFAMTTSRTSGTQYLDDVLILDFKSCHTGVVFNLPVGFEIGLGDTSALHFRPAYRMLFSGANSVIAFVPIELDLEMGISPQTDLLISGAWPNVSGDHSNSDHLENELFETRYALTLQTRF